MPPGPESSRSATDGLLLDLRTDRWRPLGWARFVSSATIRSYRQAARHRPALVEATALHGLFVVLGDGERRGRVATSWTLTVLHLGMLEDRSHLGLANTVSLARANLPVTGRRLGRWVGFCALASDLLDGRLARRTGTTTPFGRYVDPFADLVVWTWLSCPESGRRHQLLRAAVLLTWLSPTLGVTARSFARGEMVEAPRPRWIRPAVALQAVTAVRVLREGGRCG